MNETCPICNDKYTEQDIKVVYHVTYQPEITTYTCSGCNYAEWLIRNPDINMPFMEKRKELVRKWTLKNRPLIN